MSDKVNPPAEVVQSISSGAHTALSGFAIARDTIAVDQELGRQQKRDLTVSQGVVGLGANLLVGAGMISHLIICGCSLDRFVPLSCRGAGNLLYSHQVSAGIRDSGLARGWRWRRERPADEVPAHGGKNTRC